MIESTLTSWAHADPESEDEPELSWPAVTSPSVSVFARAEPTAKITAKASERGWRSGSPASSRNRPIKGEPQRDGEFGPLGDHVVDAESAAAVARKVGTAALVPSRTPAPQIPRMYV